MHLIAKMNFSASSENLMFLLKIKISSQLIMTISSWALLSKKKKIGLILGIKACQTDGEKEEKRDATCSYNKVNPKDYAYLLT